MIKLILASKSKVRKEILDKNNILNEVEPSNVDEEIVKKSLIKEKASPKIISKNFKRYTIRCYRVNYHRRSSNIGSKICYKCCINLRIFLS